MQTTNCRPTSLSQLLMNHHYHLYKRRVFFTKQQTTSVPMQRYTFSVSGWQKNSKTKTPTNKNNKTKNNKGMSLVNKRWLVTQEGEVYRVRELTGFFIRDYSAVNNTRQLVARRKDTQKLVVIVFSLKENYLHVHDVPLMKEIFEQCR